MHCGYSFYIMSKIAQFLTCRGFLASKWFEHLIERTIPYKYFVNSPLSKASGIAVAILSNSISPREAADVFFVQRGFN